MVQTASTVEIQIVAIIFLLFGVEQPWWRGHGAARHAAAPYTVDPPPPN